MRSRFTASSPADQTRPLRIGFIPLADAAPLIVAQELKFFARHGLRVELRREVGWATIREKIIHDELDAAHALAPMLWDAKLGLGSASTPVLTAFVLNLHGNALTLSTQLYREGARDGTSLRTIVRARRGDRRVTFGVVFPFSSHHLLLRSWLLAEGLQPEQDVRIVIVPPAQMFRNLVAGTIDGYCAGEPWNSLAVHEGAGWCPWWSSAQATGHVEKVLMVTERFAEKQPAAHAALVASLHEACAWCDEPQNRGHLAEILSAPRYLNVLARIVMPALTGRFKSSAGRVETTPDFIVYQRDGANVPQRTKAIALQRELVSAGLLPASAEAALPHRLFREDIYRAAVAACAPSCT